MPIEMNQHAPDVYIKHYIGDITLQEMLESQDEAAEMIKAAGVETYVSILVLTRLNKFPHNVRGMLQGILSQAERLAIFVVDPPKGARVIVNMIQHMPLPVNIATFDTLDEAIIEAEKLNAVKRQQRSVAQ